MNKYCTKCETEKPLSDFGRRGDKTLIQAWCYKCCAQWAKNKRHRIRDGINAKKLTNKQLLVLCEHLANNWVPIQGTMTGKQWSDEISRVRKIIQDAKSVE